MRSYSIRGHIVATNVLPHVCELLHHQRLQHRHLPRDSPRPQRRIRVGRNLLLSKKLPGLFEKSPLLTLAAFIVASKLGQVHASCITLQLEAASDECVDINFQLPVMRKDLEEV